MRIRCFGSRGSIAVSGPQCLKYGGDTTCVEIVAESGHIIIVDAGTGIRSLGNELFQRGPQELDLFFTHAHWDHILGFPFFKPVYMEGSVLRIHGCPLEEGDIRSLLAHTMIPPYFPVPFDQVKARVEHVGIPSDGISIGTVTVTTIPLNHPNGGYGYRFEENGRAFVFLTDNELGMGHDGGLDFADYVEFAKGASLLFHDAEYLPEEYPRTRGWGHSVYLDALELSRLAGVERFGLFHHNQDRSDDGVDAMVAACRAAAGERGPECFGVASGMDFLV